MKRNRAKRDTTTTDVKTGSTNPSPVSVPEPGSLALSLVGLIGIGLLAQRRGISQDV
ncbi:MAG: PEP-CTERM sorting domain-containing protein [Candidatus Acidiferrales bacterium]